MKKDDALGKRNRLRKQVRTGPWHLSSQNQTKALSANVGAQNHGPALREIPRARRLGQPPTPRRNHHDRRRRRHSQHRHRDKHDGPGCSENVSKTRGEEGAKVREEERRL